MRVVAFYAILVLGVPVVVSQSNSPPARGNGSHEKMCGLGTYHDSLDLAFKNATAGSGETLVTVQVLPSFRREYALVLKRVGPQVKLLRASFQNQLWTLLGLPFSNTRQQCLERALAAKVDTVELSASAETMEQLWTAFGNINLDRETCSPQKGTCPLSQDGTAFVIQTTEGRSLRLTEIGDSKRIKSENAALLEWVHALLDTAKNSQP